MWHDVSDADFPLDQSYLTALETTLSQLSAVKVIPDPEEDASYGLDAPDLTRTATISGGETWEVTVGSEVDGNYYARPAGDSQVYTIAAALMNQTEYGLMEMIELDTIPHRHRVQRGVGGDHLRRRHHPVYQGDRHRYRRGGQ